MCIKMIKAVKRLSDEVYLITHLDVTYWDVEEERSKSLDPQ
ncbi:hypothetical protein [Pleionea sediminis]|nr:hypothetical protein [Pleionea sediminis]